LVTIHRAENTNEAELLDLLETLNEIAERHCAIVFPMHPRTKNILARSTKEWRPSGHLHVVEPVGYLENLFLIEHARVVLTDSGGVQKEAFFLRTPCITLRNETEWLETVTGGGNQVVGVTRSNILKALNKVGSRKTLGTGPTGGGAAGFGDGKASDLIVEHLMSFCMEHGIAA
jgi:UDP-GlcNAc3NAcA epimerase